MVSEEKESVRARLFSTDNVPSVDQQAVSKLSSIIGGALEFLNPEPKEEKKLETDDQPEQTISSPLDAGIQLFSSSANKVVHIDRIQKIEYATEAFVARPLKPFDAADLKGVIVFPGPTQYKTQPKILEKRKKKWLLGKMIDPQAPLPQRSRYFPVLKKKPLQHKEEYYPSRFSSTRRQRRPITKKKGFRKESALRPRNPPANKPLASKPASESQTKGKKASSTGKKKQIPKNLLL